ncbi:alanine acetyltransferase [Lysobacter sp. S4-A87]|uniref:alanine acetyltransferase n=1 Tax=Lysobacter sp. S4-A87 TaxID=2925843 RepID=UPI001F52D154|nr:alanine acetyltransferase [Lysobacter sp. S4-A87]UNK48909.1 alanine acetyltransferase [Lysobacter sp. S4-A87]
MSGLWSPQQREWLQAMGHQVWALGGAQSIEAASPTEGHQEDTSAQARREAAALLKGGAAAQARPSASAPAPRMPAATDRLLMAVFRAAGRNSGDADVVALVPDGAALRGNSAAKRALWPSLRALRRRGGAG